LRHLGQTFHGTILIVRTRRKIWLIVAILGAGVLFLCGLGGMAALQVFDFPIAARQLPAAEREYRALGLPWVAADLRPRPAVVEAENAAIPIREIVASGLLEGFSREYEEIEGLLRDGRLAEAEERLRAHREVLARIVDAARRPDLDFERDWDLGPFLLLPEYAEIRSMARLLVLDGRLKAARGDTEGAASRLVDVRRIGAHAGREPIVIGHLVYVACESMALRALEDALASRRGDAAGLARLRAVAEADLSPPVFRDALRGEMYMGIAAIRNFNHRQLRQVASTKADADLHLDPATLRRDGAPRGTVERAFLARHLQMWAEAERRMARHPDDVRAQSRVVQELSARLDGERRLSHLTSALFFPVFTQAADAYVRREATERTVLAAARVLEFEARHGRFPDRLEEVGALSPDPFDGEPLRYRQTDDGFRVYSVGSNMRDEGGLVPSETPDGGDRRAGDVVAGYPPAPYPFRERG
jgi:hypothetical protein